MPSTDPYAALRYRQFRSFIACSFLNTAALLIQEVVLGYELYRITKDPLSLGFIGLAEAIPYISLALFGGHFADRYNKKYLLLGSLSIIIACSVAIYALFLPQVQLLFSQSTYLLCIYLILCIIGFAKGFYIPTNSSLKAFLINREHYANAASWSSTLWQMGAILGPGSAGFMYAYLGLHTTLLLVLVALCICFLLILTYDAPVVQISENQPNNVWQSLQEGIRFVFSTKILLYAISLDLFSVLFGGVVAILPVFATDILNVGAEGLGVLRAAPSVGAVLTIVATAYFPPTQKAWRNMLIAVTGFGLATIIFAISTNFWLSVVMLFFTGSFDSISVVVRQTILQLLPPDNMRGRVLSVNSIFVSSSNELGAFESGVAAKLLGTVPSVLLGGTVTLLVAMYVYFTSQELFEVEL